VPQVNQQRYRSHDAWVVMHLQVLPNLICRRPVETEVTKAENYRTGKEISKVSKAVVEHFYDTEGHEQQPGLFFGTQRSMFNAGCATAAPTKGPACRIRKGICGVY